MRRAVIRTPLADADRLAAAVRPDNTPDLSTRVDDGAVVTTIDRESTAGLRATLDDYLVNLAVARETARHLERYTATDAPAEPATDDPDSPDRTTRTRPNDDTSDTP